MFLFGSLLIGLGIVLFFGEVLLSAAAGRPLHRWSDTLSSMAMQASTGFVSHFGKLFLLALYVPVHGQLALFTWTDHPLQWVLAFLLYELTGYWFHRWSHETNLGWAVHAVHHQSEQLNLATAIRVAPFRSLLDWPLLLPMALLGVPPYALVALYILHAAGQYWLHVRWIPKLGPLEWLLNTPSHHRVHHGCQPGYADCNYGAHLIIYDRLFGTFVPETEEPVYGVTEPPSSWDPLTSIFEPFSRVWTRSRGWSTWDRVQVWLRRPSWTPVTGVPPRPAPPPRRTDLRPPRLVASLVTAVSASLCLLPVQAPALSHVGVKIGLGALGIWALWSLGRALNGQPPWRLVEGVRGGLMVAFAALLPLTFALPIAVVGVGVALVAWLPGASEGRVHQHDEEEGDGGAHEQPHGHELAEGA